jgi:hypothetical protein
MGPPNTPGRSAPATPQQVARLRALIIERQTYLPMADALAELAQKRARGLTYIRAKGWIDTMSKRPLRRKA